MAFRLPTFNLIVNVWHGGNAPPAPPDLVTVGNLTPGRRHITPYALEGAAVQDPANMYLLLPAGVDVRDQKGGTGDDLVEVPAGSGRMYDVKFVDDVASGFANEHRLAQLAGKGPWPVPFPAGNVPTVVIGGPSCLFAAPIFPSVNYRMILNPNTSNWFSLPAVGIPLPWPVSQTCTLPGVFNVGAWMHRGPCPGVGIFVPQIFSGTLAGNVVVSGSNQLYMYIVESGGLGPYTIDFSCTTP